MSGRTSEKSHSHRVASVVVNSLLCIAIMAIACSALSIHPFAFLAGENLLEKALHIGVSDKGAWNAFVQKGGLEAESSWLGFKVTKLQPVYTDTGVLGNVSIGLYKSFPDSKLASFDNVRSALEKECGGSWTMNQAGNGMEATSGSGVQCIAIDPGVGTVQVMMGFKEVSDPSAAAAPAPLAQPTPASAAVVAVVPAQFDGSYEGQGDGATVTVDIGPGDADGRMKVSIGAAGSGCAGSAEGSATFDGRVLRLNARDGELRCSATMRFDSSGQLVVEEGDGCNQFHGAQCAFGAVLSKISSKPTPSSYSVVQQQPPQPSATLQRSAIEAAACVEAQARCRQKSPALAQACLNALASVRGCD